MNAFQLLQNNKYPTSFDYFCIIPARSLINTEARETNIFVGISNKNINSKLWNGEKKLLKIAKCK